MSNFPLGRPCHPRVPYLIEPGSNRIFSGTLALLREHTKDTCVLLLALRVGLKPRPRKQGLASLLWCWRCGKNALPRRPMSADTSGDEADNSKHLS